MTVTKKHKKEKCPKCGSAEILTIGLDQMCCECDWDNSFLLVQLGQMDNPFQAVRQHFDKQISFEQLQEQKIAGWANVAKDVESESVFLIA